MGAGRRSTLLGATELWDRILKQAKRRVPEQSYRTWLSSAVAVSYSEGVLRVRAPSQFHAEWLEDKFGPLLVDAARVDGGESPEIHFTFERNDAAVAAPEILEVDVAGPASFPPGPPGTASAATEDLARSADERGIGSSEAAGGDISTRYTFDRFVVGENNRLAQAASLAVAERPAHAYNPLFLYGPTGLGKTHLMQAIANHLAGASPRARICYVAAEQFFNDMVLSIATKTADVFRARYRSFDLLLVDDVQFLRGKERTQEEFFNTFNSLYSGERQIVLTSDRHPKELDGLESRLVSRFEWGLVADVNPPDYETRVAILRKKAEEGNVALDADVVDLVAEICRSSVRELEGAIIKLLAFSSLTQRALTLDLARAALAGVAEAQAVELGAPDEVRNLVAEGWGVTGKALASRSRARSLVVPRQVAMFLIRELLGLPLQQIGMVFGGRDHSTVVHSIRKVERQIAADPEFKARVAQVRADLQLAATVRKSA